jgi:hypothetical protein
VFDPKCRPTLLKFLLDERDDVRPAAVKQVLAWLDGQGTSKSKSKSK